MGVAKSLAELAKDMQGAGHVQMAIVLDLIGKTSALQIVHHQIWTAVVADAKIMHSQNIGMIKSAGHFGFLLEALEGIGARYRLGMHDFDCPLALHQPMPGFVNFAHGTAADLFFYFIATAQD